MLTLGRSKSGQGVPAAIVLSYLGRGEEVLAAFEMDEQVLAFANDRNWREVLFEHSNGLLGEN